LGGLLSGIQLSQSGICFSPTILYAIAIIGCVVQVAIFALSMWVLVNGRRLRRSTSSSSCSSYQGSSRASISSKTGLYET